MGISTSKTDELQERVWQLFEETDDYRSLHTLWRGDYRLVHANYLLSYRRPRFISASRNLEKAVLALKKRYWQNYKKRAPKTRYIYELPLLERALLDEARWRCDLLDSEGPKSWQSLTYDDRALFQGAHYILTRHDASANKGGLLQYRRLERFLTMFLNRLKKGEFI